MSQFFKRIVNEKVCNQYCSSRLKTVVKLLSLFSKMRTLPDKMKELRHN